MTEKSKSPGPDEVSNEMVKKLHESHGGPAGTGKKAMEGDKITISKEVGDNNPHS